MIAAGMVASTVAVAHGLCFMTLTITRPSTALRMTMMSSVPMSAAKPPSGPSSSRAICPRLRPSRRVDSSRMVMSCTQPPNTAPTRIHSVPGR